MNLPSSNQLNESFYLQLDDWSALKVTGADATKFLNGFCTNDLTKLVEGDSCEAFFTNVKARVLAYTTICRRSADEFMVALSSPHAEALATHLDRYLIREKVDLEVLTDQAMLFTKTTVMPPAETIVIPLQSYEENASLWAGSTETIEASIEALSKANCRALSTNQFEQYRILKGVPKDRIDVDERNLPQEVDRVEQTISFTKGCYLGQEPIARIDALGQVNWLLRGLKFSSSEAPSPETELYHDGKVVGRVTSSVAAEGEVIGLGYIRRQVATENLELTYGNESAWITTLPMNRR